MLRWLLPLLVAVGGTASADRKLVVTPVEQFTPREPAASISPVMYLNRCIGGCTITSGSTNDARTNQTSILGTGTYTIGEFANIFGDTTTTTTKGHCLDPNGGMSTTACTDDAGCAALGAGAVCDTADYEWNQVVKCMQEVYSPYAVTVQETRPTSGSYTMAVIGGSHTDAAQANGVLGISPLASDCSARDNVIAFTFSNDHPVVARVDNVCWTAAQETAHAFGLDHEYEYVDGTSACNDPMTYRNDCGGEKFFRNKDARCGGPGDGFGPAPRECRCSTTQNSHQKILSVFGEGQSLIPPPTASIQVPNDGARVADNWNTSVLAGSRRGVDRVELWLNNWPWAVKPGAMFEATGQLDPAQYAMVAPDGVPNGGIKVIARAFDDLGYEGDVSISVTKGPACASDANCLEHQHCNTGAATDTVAAGGCYWDPGTVALGDSCSYPQACESRLCLGPAGGEVCTQTCTPTGSERCPTGFECDIASDNMSYCFKTDGGGCCSTATGNGWPSAVLASVVLGLVTRRRRCAA